MTEQQSQWEPRSTLDRLPDDAAFLCRALSVAGPPATLPAQPDWNAVLVRAAHDRLEIALDSVADRIAGMPPDIRSALRQRARLRVVRAMTLASEGLRLSHAFEDWGTDVLLLKGWALSQQLHGSPFRRQSQDIDLLVRPGRRGAAEAILRQAGYRPYGECRPNDREQDEQVYINAALGLSVDLHDRLASHDALLPQAFVQPWRRGERLRLGAEAVLTLSPDLAVLQAALHGTKHLWRRLGWLYDLAAGSAAGRIPWPAVLDAAAAVGAERTLLLTVLLAEDLFAAPLPLALARHSRLPEARDSLRALLPVLAAPPADSDIESVRIMGRLRYLLWENRLHRGWRRKAAALAVHARPSPSDTRLVALPRPLRGLYLPVRLGRVLWSLLRR